MLFKSITEKIRNKIQSIAHNPEKGIFLGYGENIINQQKTMVYIPWDTANRHTYILGATGSGKTVLLRNIAYQIVKAGYGMIYFDMKGPPTDGAMKDIWLACYENNRTQDFTYLSPVETDYLKSATWNPLIYGDAPTIANKIFDALQNLTPSAQFYEDVKFELFSKLISAAKTTNEIYTFGMLADIMATQEDLQKFAEKIKSKKEKKAILDIVYEWQKNPMQFIKNLKGTAVSMQKLSTGLPAKIVETKNPTLDLKKAIETQKIIFCFFPSLKAKESMRQISKMILSEIKTIVGEILSTDKRQKTKFFIVIDEFEEMIFPAIKDLFNKAREAGINLIIAHQTIADVNYETGGESFGKSIIDNTGTKIIMQTKSKDTAKYLADIIGEIQPIPILSKWMTQTYIVPPEILMGKNELYEQGLDVGEAISKIDGETYRIKIPFPERREKIRLGIDIPYPTFNP